MLKEFGRLLILVHRVEDRHDSSQYLFFLHIPGTVFMRHFETSPKAEYKFVM
jgi:hypothetical protein